MTAVTAAPFSSFPPAPPEALRASHNPSISALRAAPERTQRTHHESPLALSYRGNRPSRVRKTEQNEPTAPHLHTLAPTPPSAAQPMTRPALTRSCGSIRIRHVRL